MKSKYRFVFPIMDICPVIFFVKLDFKSIVMLFLINKIILIINYIYYFIISSPEKFFPHFVGGDYYSETLKDLTIDEFNSSKVNPIPNSSTRLR